MKIIIPIVGMVGLIGVGLHFYPNTAEVIRDKVVEEKVVEVAPDWADDEDAVAAAKAVIRKKELETELNALEADFEVHKARYESRKVEIEKELGVY